MRLKTRARVVRTLCVVGVVVLALASRASATSDATMVDDDDAPVWVPTFFDARGMTENALDASAHNALRRIDGGRLRGGNRSIRRIRDDEREIRAGEETTVA